MVVLSPPGIIEALDAGQCFRRLDRDRFRAGFPQGLRMSDHVPLQGQYPDPLVFRPP